MAPLDDPSPLGREALTRGLPRLVAQVRVSANGETDPAKGEVQAVRRFLTATLMGMLLASAAAPVFAAAPTKISFDTPEEDAWWAETFTAACGFPVSADASGHVIFHNEKRGAATQIANWQINVWLTSENGSYHLVDAGPDMLLERAGVTYFTVTGRSTTFSGVIGRVEVNTETGEIVWHGLLVFDEVFGDWTAPICQALS